MEKFEIHIGKIYDLESKAAKENDRNVKANGIF